MLKLICALMIIMVLVWLLVLSDRKPQTLDKDLLKKWAGSFGFIAVSITESIWWSQNVNVFSFVTITVKLRRHCQALWDYFAVNQMQKILRWTVLVGFTSQYPLLQQLCNCVTSITNRFCYVMWENDVSLPVWNHLLTTALKALVCVERDQSFWWGGDVKCSGIHMIMYSVVK